MWLSSLYNLVGHNSVLQVMLPQLQEPALPVLSQGQTHSLILSPGLLRPESHQMSLHIKPRLMLLNQRVNQQIQMQWQCLLLPLNLLYTSEGGSLSPQSLVLV
jgi:hypothetical protein